MPRTKKTELTFAEQFEAAKQIDKPQNLLTAPQAWKTIGGNPRLIDFVNKKYKGQKEFEEWQIIFEKDNLK